MDAYYRAVGFSKVRLSKQIARLRNQVLETPDKRHILAAGPDTVLMEYYKMYGDGVGILVRGHMAEDDSVSATHCLPYAVADEPTAVGRYLVEYINDEPVIVYEDEETGNELVFQLQNTADYLKDEKAFINRGLSVSQESRKNLVNVAGLSIYGTVILPVAKDDWEEQIRQEEESYYKNLVLRLKDGDDEAEDLLKLYAEETSDIIRERLQDEDFLSVVEGYFLPMEEYELDYSILGDIIRTGEIKNTITGEEVYKLLLNITGTKMQLYINKKDLVGMPMEGMRFMGTCRLQGSVVLN